ncbi:MAG: type II toxin-antitoxin system RelE/ParE family toxin [Gordonibacter pamelaeae]
MDTQDLVTVSCIEAAIEELERKGPSLGRPLVDHIKDSKLCNMKELRPASPGRSEVRILFAFDPKRHAIMLFAGDKSSGEKSREKWNGWYKSAIPLAENGIASIWDNWSERWTFTSMLSSAVSPRRCAIRLVVYQGQGRCIRPCQARKERDLTQREVAAKMGVSQCRVSELEAGRLATMRVDTLSRYIASLGRKLVLSAEWPDKTIPLTL